MSEPVVPPTRPMLLDLDEQQTIAGLKSGSHVLSRFKLKRCLGRGGMGEVWLAHDDTLDEQIALKLLPRLIHFDERAVDDLKNETRRGRQLSHPNIVRVFDFYKDQDNVGIAMEFVDGENLAALHAREPHGFFTADKLASWVRQLLLGLDYAHRTENVVHRDLKPANLLIDTGTQTLKIADFGIARCLADSMQRATVSAQSRGTLCYMSPEQAIGRGANPLDDIYAVGATLYQLLAGTPPFYSGDVFNQIQMVPPPPIMERQVEQGFQSPPPLHWEAAVMRCLAKERAQRPQSAMEVLDILGLRSGDSPMPTPYVIQSGGGGGAAAIPPNTHTMPAPATLPVGTQTNATSIAISTSAPIMTVLPSATQRSIDLTRTMHGRQETEQQPGAPAQTVTKRPFPVMKLVAAIVVVALLAGGAVVLMRPKPPELRFGVVPPSNPPPDPPPHRPIVPPPVIVQPPPGGPPKGDWHVPGDFATIQAALEAAKEPAQKIFIGESQWKEKLIIKSGVHLIGNGTTKSVIMVDGRSGSAIEVRGSKDVVIEGIGFSHAGDEALAAGNSTASVDGSGVSFQECAFTHAMRDGLTISGASTVKLNKCLFSENSEAGLKATGGAVVTVVECTFEKNNFGVISELSNTTVTMTGGSFSGHSASAIEASDHAQITVRGAKFVSNKENGVYAHDSGTSALVEDCDISKGESGIKAAKGAALTAINCRVKENIIGMAFDSAGNVAVRDCTIEGNSGEGMVLFAEAGAGTALINKNIIKANSFGLNIHGPGMIPDVSGNDLGPNAFADIYLHNKAAGTYSKNTLRSGEGFSPEPAGTDEPAAGTYQWATDNIVEPTKP